MNEAEVEYLAENDIISIIPTFNSPTLHLIAGEIGPFRASIPINVPLWLAVHLKQQKRCKIDPPEWMDVERLQAIKENEIQSRTFTKMPSEYYFNQVKFLLGVDADDIPNAHEIRTLVKDIWDIRMAKIRTSMDMIIKQTGTYAAIDNLTQMEINVVRELLPNTMDTVHVLKTSKGVPLTLTSGTRSTPSTSSNPFLS